MNRITKFIPWVLALVLIWAIWGQPKFVAPDLPGYVRTYDILAHGGSLRWLDNTRVWFSAYDYDPSLPKTESGADQIVFSKGILDTATGQVEYYSDPPANASSSAWCYSPEMKRLSYNSGITSQNVVAGFPGQETIDVDASKMSFRQRNRFRCDSIDWPAITGGNEGWYVEYLLPGDGFFSVRWKTAEPSRVLYHAHDKDVGREIPINSSATSTGKYISHVGAYFLGGDFNKLSDRYDAPNCKAAWWFWPKEQKLKKVCLSQGGSFMGVLPTKLGYLTYRHQFEADDTAGTSGLYLDLGPGKGWRPVVTQYATVTTMSPVFDVSPDGCKIAFVARAKLDFHGFIERRRNSRFMTIDLCTHKEDILNRPVSFPSD